MADFEHSPAEEFIKSLRPFVQDAVRAALAPQDDAAATALMDEICGGARGTRALIAPTADNVDIIVLADVPASAPTADPDVTFSVFASKVTSMQVAVCDSSNVLRGEWATLLIPAGHKRVTLTLTATNDKVMIRKTGNDASIVRSASIPFA